MVNNNHPATPGQTGKLSRNKGARGEREFCSILADSTGIPWLRRNLAQYQQASGRDIIEQPPEGVQVSTEQQQILNHLVKFSIEVKRQRKATFADVARWYKQADRQAQILEPKRIPLLAYRADRHPWRIVIPALPHTTDTDLCMTIPVRLFSQWLLDSPERLLTASRHDSNSSSSERLSL